MKFPFFTSNKNKKENTEDAASLSDFLSSITKNSVLLKREESETEPPLGTSKIGGKPHLPKDFKWPYYASKNFDEEYANRPLSFIAQIDLAAFSKFDKDSLLPDNGYLYFFYDIATQKWGFDPKDKGCARVYYLDVTSDKLQEVPLPDALAEEVQVPLSVITFNTVDELPGYEEFCALTDVQRFGSEFDWDVYEDECENIIEFSDDSPEDVCKLLGYADLVQGSMLEECASVTAGIYCGSPEACNKLSDKKKSQLAADARNWTLLAQFGTLSNDIMFGDCGCIYFYIRKDDLNARRFDRVWLCLQCG